jgi:hypothetical protein
VAILGVLAFVLASASGWLLTAALLGPQRRIASPALIWALSAGFGTGLFSLGQFLAMTLFGGQTLAVNMAMVAALMLPLLRTGIRSPAAEASGVDDGGDEPRPAWLGAVMWLALGVSALTLALFALSAPHGEWDAWSIWNVRARFLYRSGSNWADAFSPAMGWSHPDYPLLLPGAIANLWRFSRGPSTVVPVLVASAFTLGCAGVLYGTLRPLRGRIQAALAVTLLAGAGGFTRIGASQYAEAPLAFYFAAALALLALADRYPEAAARLSMVAGFALGLAAWTKNEGLLLTLAVVAARALAKRGRGLVTLAAGALPALVAVAYFKWKIAPPNDLIGPLTGQLATARLGDFSRWQKAGLAFGEQLLGFGSFVVPVALVIGAYWYCQGTKTSPELKPAVLTAGVALGLALAGYFGVYVVAPADIEWQLRTSVQRLFAHLWPASVFTLFLVVKPPRFAATASKRRSA